MTGEGKFKWYSGASYEGHWQHSSRHGHGTFVTSNGGLYVGDWRGDKRYAFEFNLIQFNTIHLTILRNGKGNEVFYMGDKYQGDFKVL